MSSLFRPYDPIVGPAAEANAILGQLVSSAILPLLQNPKFLVTDDPEVV